MSGRRVAVVSMLVLTTASLGLEVPTAAARSGVRAASPDVVQAAPATQTFHAIGAEQTFTVPAGIRTVGVHAVGGSGGCAFSSIGRGGDVTATMNVFPGELLYVEVGGNGASSGAAGFNGGGAGGGGSTAGGGGGGSDIRTAPAAADGSLATRQVVAGGGGGGGGGNSVCGGDAGGARGGSASANPGGPGTGSAGGAGGTSLACAPGGNGGAGVLGVGGAGGAGTCGFKGGGGGGGLYGGGGGAAGDFGAGGGGGSSAAPADPLATVGIDATGVPLVEITYTLGPTADAAPATISFSYQALGTTSAAHLVTVTNHGSAPLTISGNPFSGPNASEFSAGSSTCIGEIAPATSCAIGVRFTPAGAGLRSATMSLLANTGTPTTVPLTGTGVSNQFSFVKVTRNSTTGTAKITVSLLSPGTLSLVGVGLKPQLQKVAPPRATISVKPKLVLLHKLQRLGAVWVTAKVTYSPTGGDPRTKSKRVKLILN